MSWHVITHGSRGNAGSYCVLPGSTAKLAESGWDTATLRIAQQLPDCAFSKGDVHPSLSGMYVSSVESEGSWRGDIYLFTVQFLGFVGGVQGLELRMEAEGANRVERNITATDYFQGGPGYGSSDRPLFRFAGGVADALRFISLQPYCEREFITNIPPPVVYSLEALKLGTKTLLLAPPSRLDAITGNQLVANFPSGMLASSPRFVKHPGGVNMWLYTSRWECVAPVDAA